MWLGDRVSQGGARAAAEAGVGPVTIGGDSAAVQLAGEMRDAKTLAPAGMDWRPARGQQAMLLETGDGERYILGTACDCRGLSPGEVRLRSGGNWLTLGPEGVFINGDMSLYGDVHIYGRLFLNGREIGV